MVLTNEVKLFSEIRNTKTYYPALLAGSVSKQDATIREATYDKIFSRYHDLKNEYVKLFTGYTESPLLSSSYFNATVLSYVSSWAGLLSIERDMDDAIAFLAFMDLIGAADDRLVIPNIGVNNLSGIQAKFTTSIALATGQPTYNRNLGKKLIPRSVTIQLIKAGTTTITFTDDGSGNLLAAPGVLASATLNYKTGNIVLTFGTGYIPLTGATCVITATEDTTGQPSWDPNVVAPGYKNRFTSDVRHVTINTMPDMLIGEVNLMSVAGMRKVSGLDQATFVQNKLVELYTKLVNYSLLQKMVDAYDGTTYPIDLTKATTGFNEYRSRLDLFNSELTNAEAEISKATYKDARATAIVAGKDVASLFRNTKSIGLFDDNVGNYVNDLIGYYNRVPVLRSLDIGDNEGYITHKTPDGMLAPVCRGIFLPLTNTPAVGNFANPTQVTQGVYYQEGVESVATSLVQKFTVAGAVH